MVTQQPPFKDPWFYVAFVILLGFLGMLFYFITKPGMGETIQILGIIGTISTIILGVLAIWLSLYFFGMSNKLNDTTNSTLSRIEASASKAELASREVIAPLMTHISAVMHENVKMRIETSGPKFMDRLATHLDNVIKAQTPEEKEKARKAFFEEWDLFLKDIRDVVGQSGTISDISCDQMMHHVKEYLPGRDIPKLSMEVTKLALDSPFWLSFIRRISDIEEAHKFVSVKWLRETKFADDVEAQEALQIAIDKDILTTHRMENTKNPKYPILCCNLNRSNPIVKKALKLVQEK